MSERHNTLADVWLDDERKFGDLTVKRPSPHRLNVLMRRRNVYFSDRQREQTDLEAMVEVLFVFSRTQEELTAMFRDPLERWEETLDEFLASLDESVVKEWEDYLVNVLQSIQAGGVAPADQGKPGKEGPSHAS